jgi:hypothetical protein
MEALVIFILIVLAIYGVWFEAKETSKEERKFFEKVVDTMNKL